MTLNSRQFGDYAGSHQPPGPSDSSPLHDLTGTFGPKVYDELQHYGHGGQPYETGAHRVIRAARGNPEADVTVYRSAPHGVRHLDTGNWVALHPDYAAQHGMHPTDPSQDQPVYKAVVKAKHLRDGGNDVIEWGYHGPRIPLTRHQ